MMETILVTIRNPEGVIFNDQVLSLTAENKSGKFDVLPMHQDFISIIKGKVVLTLKDHSLKNFDLGNAVIKIKNNQIDVFVDIDQISRLDV